MKDNRQKLIEFVTADVIAFLVEDKNMPISEAMDIVYNSVFFSKLSDVETGMYRESAREYKVQSAKCKVYSRHSALCAINFALLKRGLIIWR